MGRLEVGDGGMKIELWGKGNLESIEFMNGNPALKSKLFDQGIEEHVTCQLKNVPIQMKPIENAYFQHLASIFCS